MRQKEEFPAGGGGGGGQEGDQSHSPRTPVATFGPVQSLRVSGNLAGLKTRWRVLVTKPAGG
jgi:hypothetical protein